MISGDERYQGKVSCVAPFKAFIFSSYSFHFMHESSEEGYETLSDIFTIITVPPIVAWFC